MTRLEAERSFVRLGLVSEMLAIRRLGSAPTQFARNQKLFPPSSRQDGKRHGTYQQARKVSAPRAVGAARYNLCCFSCWRRFVGSISMGAAACRDVAGHNKQRRSKPE